MFFSPQNRYRIQSSQKKIRWALAAIWLLSLLVGFVPFGWAEPKPENSDFINCTFTNVIKMDYMIYLSFFAGTLIPLIVMCILYAKIFCLIRTKLQPCSMNVNGQRSFYRQEFRTAKSLALVLFLFAVCWLPLCILNCIEHLVKRPNPPLTYVGILLTHSNSVMNPIVYTFRIKKFRETCIQILRTCIAHKDSEDATSPSPTTSERS